ncbi:hypothetical protein M3D51_10040 [Micrococcus luteus]|nr:hypothetical protein [Micrococcus luteus]
MSPRRRPGLPFEQPALPDLEALPAPQPSRPAPRRASRPRSLAVVADFPARDLDVQAAELVATLNAVGLLVDQHQARTLAAAGVTGLSVWTWPGMSPAARERAERTATALAADVARRRAEHRTREVLP